MPTAAEPTPSSASPRAPSASPPPAEPGAARPWARAGLVTAPVLAALATLAGLGLTGELAGQQLLDPGPVVRYGLPVVRAVHDLCAAGTIGLLVVAVTMLPDDGQDRFALRGLRGRVVRWGGLAACAWGASIVAMEVLTCSDITGIPLDQPGFGRQLVFFAGQIELGQIYLVTLAVVLLCAYLALFAGRLTTAAWATVASLAALAPLALGGHASGSNDHMNAVNSLAAHLVGVTVWVGGAAALLMLVLPGMTGSVGPLRLDRIAARFSVVAAWCFAAVALSGLDSAWLRVGGLRGLDTRYGVLVLTKTGALFALGLAGWMHRRVTLPRLQRDPGAVRPFVRLLAAELAVMGLATGAAVALSRSAPPVPQSVAAGPHAAYRALVGFAPPPPMSATTVFTEWYVDWLLLAISAALAGVYLTWAARLRRRGDAWPWWRTTAWAVGCLLLAWLTSGGPTVYGMTSFSGHMLMHMMLMLGVPPLLVVGAPVTLALRAVPARADSSAGPREWLLTVVHSRLNQLLSHPAVAGLLFSGSLVVFYSTRLFPLAMATHTGHMLMTAHFLVVGYLFAWSLIGTDPGAQRSGYPLKLLVLIMTMAVHAFFSVVLMSSSTVLAAGWWRELGITDTAALLHDQHTGAAIAWATGDIPTPLLALAVAVLWARESEREARRFDRQADRDGDAALKDYNARLAALAARAGGRPGERREA
ncbi:cytochrome c oxidase assembly protein [Spongisporangium articulatum]|uniref:Cytochrome c oxidase assembly protein n=1 Tax=Spongisporangium articulatum TaxID=3362603 RepID=A0ABW8ANA6_9ACTN